MPTYPSGLISQYGINQALTNQSTWICYEGIEGSIFYLAGPQAPITGAQTGVALRSISGIMPPWTALDLRGARQDGATFTDAVYDIGEIEMVCEAYGTNPQATRNVMRDWINAWDAKVTGTLSVFTPDMGEWWADVRMGKTIIDPLKKDYTWSGGQKFTWKATNYDAFWYSVDSTCTFQGSSGFVQLTNYGDQVAYPRYLLYGPGTFSMNNGPGTASSTTVTLGPLNDGQVVLVVTDPMLRNVVDLSPGQPPQPATLNKIEQLLENLISFATNNNVPPLLQRFESRFGVLPPQGNIYALMNGRFTNPIPAAQDNLPLTVHIPVGISGGSSASKIVASVTPRRRWPL